MRTHVLVPTRNAAAPFAIRQFGDFDSLFDEFWRGVDSPVPHSAVPGAHAPRMDYSVDDGVIRIEAEMPGLDEQDIEVSLEEGVLTIKGEHSDERTEGEGREGQRAVETFRRSYHRAIRLPSEVDENAVKADYKSGILTVTLPKLPEVKPQARMIPVSTS